MARSLVVNILSDASKFDKGINQADRSVKGFEGSVKKAETTVSKFDGRVAAARNTLQTFGKLALAGAGAAVVKFGVDAVKAASDLGESINAVEQTFESASDTVLDFGENAASAVGLSSRAFNELVTPIGALLRNFGFSAQEAADQALILTTRAADLASVFNVDVSQALGAVQAALRGEGDPIERFGANVSAARVEAFALAEGLADTKSEIDDSVKVMGRLGLILQDTERFAGDFAETAGGAANASKTLAAEFENFKAAIGSAGVGPAADFIGFLTEALFTVETIINRLQFDGVERDLGAAALRAKELKREIGGITQANRVAAFGFLLRETTVNFEDLTEAGQSFVETEEDLVKATEGTADEIRLLAEETGITSDELEDLAERGAAFLADAFGITANEAENLIPILERIADELQIDEGIDAYAARMQGIADAYADVGGAAGGAAGENQELASSFLAVLQARKELVDPLFAAAQSQKRLADARQELVDVQEDEDATLEDIARAQLDVVAAQADAQISTEEFARGFEGSFQAALDISGLLREDLLDTLAVLGLLNDLTPIDILKVTLGQSSLGAIAPNPANDPRNFPRSDRQFVPTSSSSGSIVMNNTFNVDGANASETVREIDRQLQRFRGGVI